MARNKVKKEKPPVRLLGTMFLLVLGLVAVYVGMALGIFTLVQRLVHLEDASYTLLWPILILSVSAILGVLLAIFIFRGYLAPLSRLMQATQSVAEGDYTVRVDMRGARGEVAEYIRSFNKMAEELSSVALLLRYGCGYSTRETASLLELSFAAAQKLLQRAKAALRQELEKEGLTV